MVAVRGHGDGPVRERGSAGAPERQTGGHPVGGRPPDRVSRARAGAEVRRPQGQVAGQRPVVPLVRMRVQVQACPGRPGRPAIVVAGAHEPAVLRERVPGARPEDLVHRRVAVHQCAWHVDALVPPVREHGACPDVQEARGEVVRPRDRDRPAELGAHVLLAVARGIAQVVQQDDGVPREADALAQLVGALVVGRGMDAVARVEAESVVRVLATAVRTRVAVAVAQVHDEARALERGYHPIPRRVRRQDAGHAHPGGGRLRGDAGRVLLVVAIHARGPDDDDRPGRRARRRGRCDQCGTARERDHRAEQRADGAGRGLATAVMWLGCLLDTARACRQ